MVFIFVQQTASGDHKVKMEKIEEETADIVLTNSNTVIKVQCETKLQLSSEVVAEMLNDLLTHVVRG